MCGSSSRKSSRRTIAAIAANQGESRCRTLTPFREQRQIYLNCQSKHVQYVEQFHVNTPAPQLSAVSNNP